MLRDAFMFKVCFMFKFRDVLSIIYMRIFTCTVAARLFYA